MSDDYRKIYKQYANEIEPSNRFKEKLVQELSQENLFRRKKKKMFPYVAVAASVLLIVGASMSIYRIGMENQQDAVVNVWDTASLNMLNGGYTAHKGYGTDGKTGMEVEDPFSEVLAQKMKESLLVLVYDTDDSFEHAEVADQDTVDTLSQQIQTARKMEKISADELDEESKIFYRAMFTDGTLISFYVTEHAELVIQNENIVYEIM